MGVFMIKYRSSNHIKSDGSASTPRHPFSTYVRGVDTMPDITLPLFSLQPETKEIPLSGKHGRDKFVIVDASDYEWLSQWKWYALACWGGRLYAVRQVFDPSKKRRQSYMWMHRLILDAPAELQVDHIDGDGLNNTRGNLRLATRAQNGYNSIKHKKSRVSKYKGVTRRKNKWRVEVYCDHKCIVVGLFNTEVEAALAYNDAAKKYHGEFAYLNVIEDSK